ncbi:MAG: molybdopterin-dependent oxidoreductase [Blastocatellia bacterium]|nr:molybdopterin-dependent oxidoreductase [Blastocatellia bacterium]
MGPSPAYSYSAAIAEVDVDPETGLVAVERIYIAHDIGRSINPTLVMGQVEGSVYMGLGEAPHGSDGVPRQPRRRAQVPVDARIQESDDDGDVRRRHLPHRRSGSERAVRCERGRAGTTAADHACRRERGVRCGRCAGRRGADLGGEGAQGDPGEGGREGRPLRTDEDATGRVARAALRSAALGGWRRSRDRRSEAHAGAECGPERASHKHDGWSGIIEFELRISSGSSAWCSSSSVFKSSKTPSTKSKTQGTETLETKYAQTSRF